MYNKDGWPFTVQQHANVATNNIKAPVPTKTYGTEFEKSALNSKNLISFTCIQIPAHNIARPVACVINKQFKHHMGGSLHHYRINR